MTGDRKVGSWRCRLCHRTILVYERENGERYTTLNGCPKGIIHVCGEPRLYKKGRS